MRLAFASPLPPAATGVADYAADLLQLLAARHEIDVFHAQDAVDTSRLPRQCVVLPAAELVERHAADPYDVVVHQMGNSADHAFVYDLVSRAPGLLVLHETVLFHSRAAMLTEAEPVRAWRRSPDSPAAALAARPWLDAWRDELAYSYPGAGQRLFAAHLGTVGDLLPYAYPLCRIPVEASKAVLVHSACAAQAVDDEVAGALVFQAPLVVHPVDAGAITREAVLALRSRLGFAPEHIVVGTFGLLTREKRVDALIAAVARASARDPRLRLLLAGPVAERADLEARLEAHGLREHAMVTGRVPLEALPTHVEAADVVVHLRWPTGRESSAALLRVMAQGRPVIISDLRQQAGIPDDAVRRVDLAQEERSLEHEILALAAAPPLRQRLGSAAAGFVRTAHAPELVLQRWQHALETTRSAPLPPRFDWPPHWPRP